MLEFPELAGVPKLWGGDGPLRATIKGTICGELLPAQDGRAADRQRKLTMNIQVPDSNRSPAGDFIQESVQYITAGAPPGQLG